MPDRKPVKRPVRLVTGKGEFIKRVHEDGTIENVCECTWNSEFSVRGCPMQCFGELLEEVIQNQGAYAPGNFIKYKMQGKTNQKCTYCYARWKNNGQVYPREVNKVTRADFERIKPKVIRLGKITEAGHPYYYEILLDFFDLCKEFNTKIIFTTKALPFGLEGALETKNYAESDAVARLAQELNMMPGKDLAAGLKEVGATLLYSIGYDCMEPGAVTQGFTNEWRIKQAEKYHEQGVNTSLTAVFDVTNSTEGNAKAGSSIKQALESRDRTGINFRILPLRINSEKVAKIVTGKSMKTLSNSAHYSTQTLKGFRGDYAEEIGKRPYEPKGNNELIPVYFHPEIKALVDSGIGVCGGVGELEYCDKCNLTNQRIVFNRSELPVITYEKKFKGRFSSEKRALRKHPKLF